ncbi:MAG TPA: ABC transporter ATP-binding protein [Candidatus Omnitrophota bacterium]|nr:ABC transporter ATP-binding protein [Candidatus Omnitrophota bacterium]
MKPESLIKIKDLTGGYPEKPVICGVSFNIAKGDFLGIIGPNGSGKSTLVKLMTRAIPIQKGNVHFEGRDIMEMSLKEISRKAAFVPQETLVNFPFTVKEIVLMGRIPHLKRLQTETKKDYEIVKKAMELTNTWELKDKNINELSAGERQRAIIARALAQEPELLILDEPTSHLDIGNEIKLLDLIKKLNVENSLTVVIIIHDLNIASEYCGRLMLIMDGKIYKEGSAKEVLTYQNIETVYRTVVVVKENPISNKPYCMPISESLRKDPGKI